MRHHGKPGAVRDRRQPGPRDPGHFTQKQWQGITPSMFQRAGLNDEEQRVALEFLMTNAKH